MGKSDDGKEEDAGILAYAKDDDAVSADLHRRKACVSLSSEGIGSNVICSLHERQRKSKLSIVEGAFLC